MSTIQENFWLSDFGKAYTDRNEYATPSALDAFCKKQFGVTRSEMNTEFYHGLSISSILEMGCNTGNQLNLLQAQGYRDLYGIELQEYAVEKAKQLTKHINIILGSGFDTPFKDAYFDLVFTAGVLIHISPNDIERFMKEVYRVAKRYIAGFEYYHDEYIPVVYRGNTDRLWKGNFCAMYQKLFPDLKVAKEKKYPYLENENVDMMFLLEKIQA